MDFIWGSALREWLLWRAGGLGITEHWAKFRIVLSGNN